MPASRLAVDTIELADLHGSDEAKAASALSRKAILFFTPVFVTVLLFPLVKLSMYVRPADINVPLSQVIQIAIVTATWQSRINCCCGKDYYKHTLTGSGLKKAPG